MTDYDNVKDMICLLCDLCNKHLGSSKADVPLQDRWKGFTVCNECREHLRELIQLKKKLK